MSKIKKVLATLLAVAMLAGISTSVMAEEGEDTKKYTVSSNSSMKLTDIVNAIPFNVEILEFIVDDSINGNNYVAGYVNAQKLDNTTLVREFVEDYRKLLSDAQSNSSLSSDILADIEERILKISMDINYEVISLSVQANKAQVNKMVEDDFVVAEATEINNDQFIGLPASERERSSAYASNWCPSSGSAMARPSSSYSDATYLELYFMWNSSSALVALNDRDDRTFESEIIFYNYDKNAMSTKYANYAYSTNLPSAYRDTQFNYFNNDEPNFSIGCSQASQLQANKSYYWICYGNKNSSGSKAKVNFQKGHRAWDYSNSTWNIFADETIKAVGFDNCNTSNSSTIYF